MVAIYLSPIYITINAYLVYWILKWLSALGKPFRKKWLKIVVILIYFLLSTSMVPAFFLKEEKMRRIMKIISNYWLGIFLYAVLTVFILSVIVCVSRLIRRKKGKLSDRKILLLGTICAVTVTTVCLKGVANARIIRTTPYDISVNKDGGKLDSLKVVLVADLHLGYNIGLLHMKQMVKKINAQKPDLVVFAGDIFNNEYESIKNPDKIIDTFRMIQAKYGCYACYGNHDIEEPILAGFTFPSDKKKMSSVEMDEFLEKAGIKLLKDEKVLLNDSVWLYGRPDASRPNRGIDTRKTPTEITKELGTDKPIIVIDHQPSELEELSEAGVDVDLCGHTHDGQLFPGNLTVGLKWKNAYGYLQKGNMHNIVTSGVGLFGPNMRVGTKSEICAVTIHFAG